MKDKTPFDFESFKHESMECLYAGKKMGDTENEWRQRPLDTIYPFVFLDCMFYKVKENGSVTTRAVYNIWV